MSRQHRLDLGDPPELDPNLPFLRQLKLNTAAKRHGLGEVELHVLPGKWDPELRLTLRGDAEIQRVLLALSVLDALR